MSPADSMALENNCKMKMYDRKYIFGFTHFVYLMMLTILQTT